MVTLTKDSSGSQDLTQERAGEILELWLEEGKNGWRNDVRDQSISEHPGSLQRFINLLRDLQFKHGLVHAPKPRQSGQLGWTCY